MTDTKKILIVSPDAQFVEKIRERVSSESISVAHFGSLRKGTLNAHNNDFGAIVIDDVLEEDTLKVFHENEGFFSGKAVIISSSETGRFQAFDGKGLILVDAQSANAAEKIAKEILAIAVKHED
ncbi:hypothetical protein L0Y46_03615 [bacterium]|nr:hypothetical protein [bacterium]